MKSLLLYLKLSHLFDIVTEEHKVNAAETQLGYVEEQIHHTPETQKTNTETNLYVSKILLKKNTCIHQGLIKLIKSDIKSFLFQINVLFKFLLEE